MIHNCKLTVSNHTRQQSQQHKTTIKTGKIMNSSTRSIESFKVLATYRKNRLNSNSFMSPRNDSNPTYIMESKEDVRSQTIEEVIKNLNADSSTNKIY